MSKTLQSLVGEGVGVGQILFAKNSFAKLGVELEHLLPPNKIQVPPTDVDKHHLV